MTKDEFITLAASLGYCTRAEAEAYAKAYAGQRTEFTEADLEEVYRYAERRWAALHEPYPHGEHPLPGGGRTTKKYTVYNGHGG